MACVCWVSVTPLKLCIASLPLYLALNVNHTHTHTPSPNKHVQSVSPLVFGGLCFQSLSDLLVVLVSSSITMSHGHLLWFEKVD